jgi:hypothetical protein
LNNIAERGTRIRGEPILIMQWRSYGVVGGAVLTLALAFLPALVFGQQKPAANAAKPATPTAVKKRPPRGPMEKIDCKVGTEDQHARIAVLAQGGEVQSVAYYSKWKPRTCSIHFERGDAYSKWNDVGDATTIKTEHGDFLIQATRGEYQLFFREVDRMHYCGMMGKLNGSMTVTRGPRLHCEVTGIMDRNDTEALDESETSRKTARTPGDTIPQTNSTD